MKKKSYVKAVESSEPNDSTIKQKLMDEMNPKLFYKFLLKNKIVDKHQDIGLHLFTPEQMIFMDYHEDIDRNFLYTLLDDEFVQVGKDIDAFYESKREQLADIYMNYLGEDDTLFNDVIIKLKKLKKQLGIDILRLFDEHDAMMGE